MKKLFLLLACLLNAVWASAQFSGSGSGTESDPYLIFNPIQLNQVRGFLNKSGVYFKMMADIDLTEWIAENDPTSGWQPIGTSSEPFKGVFNGNGKKISGLKIVRPSDGYVGMFAKIDGATIKDLTIEGNVQGGNDYVGCLAGYCQSSTVSNINITCPVSGKNYTGGVFGETNYSTISNIKMYGNIRGMDYIGGITGKVYNENNISNIEYIGDISAGNFAGGITGCIEYRETKFTSCIVETHIFATGENIGGIVGYAKNNNSSNATITSCIARGSISGNRLIGGIIGHSERYSHINISSSGVVMDIVANKEYVGGIAGFMNEVYDSNIMKSYVIGDIQSEDDNIGGICGGMKTIGSAYTIKVSNCYYSGTISGKNNIGGIAGTTTKGSIPKFEKCYSTGTISGYQNVGGIVGDFENGTINSCVSIHDNINAITSDVGRIYGKKTDGTIGTVGSQIGNLGLTTCKVVCNGVLQTITNSEQHGSNTGRSTLKVRGTYQAIGWDFNDDWNILDTESYPYSKNQMAPPVIEGGCYSGSTTVTGKSVNGGTVYLTTNGKTYSSKVGDDNKWSITIDPLQGGINVEVYADDETQVQSYKVTEGITYQGKGTEADPYKIYTAADLANANGNYYYKLMNDVDLTEYINTYCGSEGWKPIGKGSSVMANFDGDGHTVSGLWINTTEDYTGLFSNATSAYIKNLNVSIASGKKVKGGNYTGGIIGRIYNGAIENCTLNGDVEGTTITGGIVGYGRESILKDLMLNGNVSSSTASAFVGGIAGVSTSTASLCSSTGTVNATGDGAFAGGIIGKNDTGSSLKDSYSTSEITSNSYVGGVVGYNYGSIENCYASGNLKSQKDFGGGVVGYNDGTAATTKHSVAINTKIEIADEHGWASRVVGGIKNSAPTPDMDNYANKEMVISINGIPMKLYDDNLNGTGIQPDNLKLQSIYSALGWDFTKTWLIDEGNGYPYLLAQLPELVTAKSITIDKQEATIEIGQNVTLNTTVLPEDAFKKDVTWRSTNTSVATVADGMVSGIAIGQAFIIATTTDGTELSDTCTVTVTAKIIDYYKEVFAQYKSSWKSDADAMLKNANVQAILSLIADAKTTIDGLTYDESKSLDENKAAVDAVITGMVSTITSNNYLVSLTIGDNAETVYSDIFNSTQLQKLSIGKSVVNVCAQAFSNCTALAEIYCYSKEPPYCEAGVFNSAIYSTAKLYVPEGCLNVYRNTSPWSSFTNIIEFEAKSPAQPNTIFAEDITSTPGKQIVMPIYLSNEDDVCNFQFQMYLPQGISVAEQGSRVKSYVITKGENRFDGLDHSVSSSLQNDGSVLVLVSSTTNTNIWNEDENGNDIRYSEPILYVTLDVASDVTEGSYNIQFKKATLTSFKNGQTIKMDLNDTESEIRVINKLKVQAECDDAKGSVCIVGVDYDSEDESARAYEDVTVTAVPANGYTFWKWTENEEDVSTDNPYTFRLESDRSLTAEFVLLGDVYEDALVDVADLTSVAGIILTASEPDYKTMLAADVYKDESIDVADFTSIAGIILGGGSNAKSIGGRMNNIHEVVNMQFDVCLPENISISERLLSEALRSMSIAYSHDISVKEQKDGSLRVLVTSFVNSPIENAKDNVCNIMVGNDGMLVNGNYGIILKNVVLAYSDMTAEKIDTMNAKMIVDDATRINGMNGLTDSKGPIFCIDGRKAENINKGKIYIRKGKSFIHR